MLALCLTLPAVRHRASAPNSAEAQQFFDRLATPPSGADETAWSTFIDGLVSAGIWAKLDGLFIRSTKFASDSLVNLIGADPQCYVSVLSSSLTWTQYSGWLNPAGGAAAARLATTFFPNNTGSQKFQQQDACFGIWSGTNFTATHNPWVVQEDDAGNQYNKISAWTHYTGNVTEPALNSTGYVNWAMADNSGLVVYTRVQSDTTHMAVYRNGSVITPGTGSGVVNSASIDAHYLVSCPAELERAFFFGSGLSSTDVSNLYSLMSDLMTYLVGSLP